MPKVNEIRTALFEAAPEYMKMEWDNVGLMCGHAAQEVTRVLVALDASYRVLNEAKAAHCELVVCHHPLIFGGTKTVTDETPVGRSLLFAIENGVSEYTRERAFRLSPFMELLGYQFSLWSRSSSASCVFSSAGSMSQPLS